MPVKHVEMFDTPGLVQDVPEQHLVESAVTDAKNFRFNQRGAQTMPGDQTLFTPASVTPLWLSPFPPITDPVWVYATLTELWTIEGTTHLEITRAAGDYSGTAGERWNSCVLAGHAFFNNTVDVPQSWAGFDPTTPAQDLANWTSTRRCKSLRSFKNFLVALNMKDSGVERPYRVVWSSPAQPGAVPPSWDTADPAQAANEFDLSETSDHLVDQRVLGDINIIYKEATTWGMSYIGPPYWFRFWNILPDRGLLWRDCVGVFSGGHILATQDDIVVHTGQFESDQSIIDRKLRNWIFRAIDQTNYRASFMLTYPAKNEAWFCFPEAGATYASIAIIWNWKTNSIGVRDLPEAPFIAMGPVGDTLVTDLIWDPAP